MEWTVFIKHNKVAYRAFKIRQGANFGITIIPQHAVFFPRKVIENLEVGLKLGVELEYNESRIVDHYSAHSLSGQRHYKLNPIFPATEPILGDPIKEINKVIPLVSLVATTNENSKESPSSGKWFGYNLPDDVNYLIFDIYAIPNNKSLQFTQGYKIENESKTNEIFDHKVLIGRNCKIAVFSKASNNMITEIPHNIIFQQSEGKTIVI
ncbi:MAG: hypothetical protein NUV82_01010, partial [Candidatus Komeilibacteria bacterium]|nr:hypothetical protein [Candidatus Komeilibacteria bacterium]